MNNPFEEFLRAIRESMANRVAEQVSLPSDLLHSGSAMSAKFYAAVPVASLKLYLKEAEDQENYKVCVLIRDELSRRAL